MFTRSFGFSPGEQYTSIMRKRYRLVQNSEIQLIHYIKQYEVKTPVNQHLAKTMPRTFKPQPQQQQTKWQTPMVKVVDEIVEQGDENDKKYSRVLALERYRRNHLNMEEIFSAYPTNTIKNEAIPDVKDVDRLHVSCFFTIG